MEALDRRAFLARAGGAAALAAGLGPGWEAVSAAAGGTAAADPRLRALARAVRGPVLARGARGYAGAARLFNTRFDGVAPLAVLLCERDADVKAAVRWARRYGVRIVARSGGHSYAGYSTTRGGLVIDLRRLNGVRYDRASRTAVVGPGARLIDVYAALARSGVTVPGGSCPTVGIGGLALGGGVGLAARRFGTTSDNIVALRIVTADGRLLTANARSHPDLFWACRGGGGGNFGIVTAFRFRAHPARSAAFFFARWPYGQAEDVLAAWQALAPEAPDQLYSLCTLSAGGGGSPSITALGQWFGSAAQLRRVIRPLTGVGSPALTIGTDSYLRLQQRWGGCLGESFAACARPQRQAFAAKSDYARRSLPAAGRARLVRAVASGNGLGAGVAAILDSYGGAINRVPASATAFVHRDERFSIQWFSSWEGSAAAGGARRWLRSAHGAMRPYVSGAAYQNYIDPGLDGWERAYYGRNLPRLVAVKRRYDPDDVFRFRQSIPPHV